jgi:hypothetical protein
VQSVGSIILRQVVLASSQCSIVSIAQPLLCFVPSTSDESFLLSVTIVVDANLELRPFFSSLKCL